MLIAADAKDDATKKDLEKIQGTWVSLSAESSGKKVPEKELKDVRHTFKGGKIIVDHRGSKIEIPFTLDVSKKPKTIDLTIKGKKGVRTVKGIYELSGDEFKMCTDEYERPKEFQSTSDNGYKLTILKREKK